MSTSTEEVRNRRQKSGDQQSGAGPEGGGTATASGNGGVAAGAQAFPFPQAGRVKPKTLPRKTETRWSGADIRTIDDVEIPPRHVRASVTVAEFKQHVAAFADDVGLIDLTNPAIAHEVDGIRYVYPHAKTLVCLVGKMNTAAMQSRYLPTANLELHGCEDHLFEMCHETIAYVETLGGAGLTTAVGWPMDLAHRWSDKLWPLSHRLVAQAAGLGAIGFSRNFLHRKFGAHCLLDTVITNLEFPAEQFDTPVEFNPCEDCSLCVAACPSGAIQSDGDFDFFACYNHTYRDSIPGFLDLVRDLAAGRPNRFEKRWTDTELVALWQSLTCGVQYRCFNCTAVCPSFQHPKFHEDKAVRRDAREHGLKPLLHTRKTVNERFIIDTASAREEFGIPPGEWRTPVDTTKPSQAGVRLVDLGRLRTSNVGSMMRGMPHAFRPSEAKGLDFTLQFDLTGPGGGRWVMRVVDQQCQVTPGDAEQPDLTVRCAAELFLGVHRGTVNAPLALLLGRIKLTGDKALFLKFPAIMGVPPGDSLLHRVAYRLRKLRGSSTNGSATKS